MNTPFRFKVSIIIPFYKNKDWLLEALNSVSRQTFQDYEVIIINDGSTENISDIESIYPQFNFFKIDNSGPGKARNYGINLSSGEYIAFLDSDDLWLSNKLEVQIKYMDKLDVLESHTNYLRFKDKRSRFKKINCNFKGYVIPQIFIRNPIATPCIIIRNDILIEDRQLRFAENTRVGEDSHFWFKLAEQYALGFIDNYLSKVRIRGLNAAFQSYLQLKNKAENYELVLESEKYFNNKSYFNIIKFGFWYSKKAYDIVCCLEKRTQMNIDVREVLSKIFYSFPYLFFKLISLFKADPYLPTKAINTNSYCM